ncbi:Tn3 family transposase [Paraburkholderia sp. GAS334]|uniref:Tn3 family transposase n=1 Tax=Paraburkholderia sp. GAS334 TaxID=3035131 RepID=UPI003D24E401
MKIDRNGLARSVLFCRHGEIRDHSFESPLYRVSGPHPATAAILLWNTVEIERAVQARQARGTRHDSELLP